MNKITLVGTQRLLKALPSSLFFPFSFPSLSASILHPVPGKRLRSYRKNDLRRRNRQATGNIKLTH